MIDAFADFCGQLPVDAAGSFFTLLSAIFIMAFIGSFAHCAWMCGPLVMMQTSARLTTTSATTMTELTRLKGAALLPYHLGRISTYTLLGAIAASLGNVAESLWREAGAILILAAGVGIILVVLKLPRFSNRAYSATVLSKNLKIDVVKRLFANPTGGRGYLLGVLLGFLPCGMVYAALAAAAASPSIWHGAIVMFAFGTATIPALFAVALLGNMLFFNLKKKLSLISKTVSLLTGAWLCLVALNILLK